jgi:thiol-disulfide isomerase/thioredoxin
MSSGPAKKRPRVQAPRSAPKQRTGTWFWVGLAALVAVAAAVAIFVGRDDSEPAATRAEASAVTVEGQPLPQFESNDASDSAVGMQVPSVSGSSLDGSPLTVPNGKAPYVVAVLAHWCPHCQDEVPRLVDWMQSGEAPEDVSFFAVATANDPDADNYPAEAWLEREGWEVPTLLDDDQSTAAGALGTTGFPYFVFVDADGEVASRYAGELPVEELEQRVAALTG